MLKPEFTTQFKRDFKLAQKRGLRVAKLEDVIRRLCGEELLPEQFKDHSLVNSKHYQNMRECHIESDWLLVYQIEQDRLVLKLIRTGSHSDLF